MLSTVRLLLAAAVLLPGLASANVEREWRFRVSLDDSEVGMHTFRVTERGRERLVESRARFRVKFLFFEAYSYGHQASERWRNDCLVELAATTNDNGERTQVRGTGDDARFEVEVAGTRVGLPGCVMSFAYWNPAMLEQRRLLNVQTGELTEVRVEPLGMEEVLVRGDATRAQRFAVHAPKFRIDLWYAAGERWVKLESRTEGGRLLRYEIQ